MSFTKFDDVCFRSVHGTFLSVLWTGTGLSYTPALKLGLTPDGIYCNDAFWEVE